MATIVLKLRGRELSRHPITKRITRIGRDATNDVSVDNPGVSRMHASVRFTGGGFHVVDEGSANGIFVNGEEVDTLPLTGGDEIQFGKFIAVFLLDGGSSPQDLQDAADEGQQAVDPVETTSISTTDLRRMIAERSAAPTSPSLPPSPPFASPRHQATYAGPPATMERAPVQQPQTSQALLLAVGAMGAVVVVLAGVVVYLLVRT